MKLKTLLLNFFNKCLLRKVRNWVTLQRNILPSFSQTITLLKIMLFLHVCKYTYKAYRSMKASQPAEFTICSEHPEAHKSQIYHHMVLSQILRWASFKKRKSIKKNGKPQIIFTMTYFTLSPSDFWIHQTLYLPTPLTL